MAVLPRSPKEFSNHLKHALGHDPKPMTPAERQRLTWEDATERFLDAAALTDKDQPGPLDDTLDRLAWFTHNTLTGAPQLIMTLPVQATLVSTGLKAFCQET